MIPRETIMDPDYAAEIALLVNTTSQAESWLYSLEQAAKSIALHVNADKTEYMCFDQKGDISSLNGDFLKLVNKFTYFSSSVSSTESDMNMWLAKAWTATYRLSII